VHLAKGASTPEQRDHFAKLARTWIKLAEELEQTEVFLAAFEDDEPAKQVRLKRKPRRVCYSPISSGGMRIRAAVARPKGPTSQEEAPDGGCQGFFPLMQRRNDDGQGTITTA